LSILIFLREEYVFLSLFLYSIGQVTFAHNNIYNALSKNVFVFWQHKLKKKKTKPEDCKLTSGMLFFFINRVSAKGLVILDEITVFAYFYYKRLMAVYQGAYINFPPEVKPIG